MAKAPGAIIGGHLEYGEEFEACARRETREETGFELQNVETISVANHIFANGKHYISIYLIGQIAGPNETPAMDPREFSDWRFFADWCDLPDNLFVPYQLDVPVEQIDQYKRAHGLAPV